MASSSNVMPDETPRVLSDDTTWKMHSILRYGLYTGPPCQRVVLDKGIFGEEMVQWRKDHDGRLGR